MHSRMKLLRSVRRNDELGARIAQLEAAVGALKARLQ